LLASGMSSPNGITFNEDYTALYIGEFYGDGRIHKLPIDGDGNPGTMENWTDPIGSGGLDGLGVDICGNVYVCDYGDSIIYRISSDGQDVVPLINPGGGTYMPNFQWGVGFAGWKFNSIYIPEGWQHYLREVDIGVPGKPRVYP